MTELGNKLGLMLFWALWDSFFWVRNWIEKCYGCTSIRQTTFLWTVMCFVLHLNLSRLAGWVDGRINWNYNHLSSLVELGLGAELGNSWMLSVVSETRRFWGNIKTFAPPDKNPGYATGLGIYSFFGY